MVPNAGRAGISRSCPRANHCAGASPRWHPCCIGACAISGNGCAIGHQMKSSADGQLRSSDLILPESKSLRGRIATLAPLLHWRVCHIWEWLRHWAPNEEFGGWPTEIIRSDPAREQITARAHRHAGTPAALARVPYLGMAAPLGTK